jgi:hypothetical protein
MLKKKTVVKLVSFSKSDFKRENIMKLEVSYTMEGGGEGRKRVT